MIHAESIHKSFGPLSVLRGVDLETRRGRITALVGPNGSGKTTLVKMILGLVQPDRGTLHLGNQPVASSGNYRSVLGYMPQIVRFPGNLTGNEICAMLTDLRGFDGEPDRELVDSFELGQEMDRPLKTLSGGTRQKVNAAIAFLFRPDVMILDEPTAGLDPVAGEIFREKLQLERSRGRTFVITSHDMAHLEAVADDIAFLLDGKMIYQGSVSDLKEATETSSLSAAIAHLMKRREAA